MMKLGNRKKRRPEYLLDVKVQTRGRALARLRVTLMVFFFVSVFLATCYGLYHLIKTTADRLVYNNPRFAIQQIVVDDDGVLTPERVVQFAGVRVGQNLLSLDLTQVRNNLEMLPLVRAVEVRRMLPNRLFIHVEERIAVAQLRVPTREFVDSSFYIDRSGVVMKPLKLSDGTVLQPQMPRPVPTLTGVSLADLQVGRQVESEQIYRALELLDKLDQAVAGSLIEVEQIDLSKTRQLVLTTRQHTQVKLDVEDFPQQMRRLGVILRWAQQRQKTIQVVDLTVNRGVPVTFVN
ncbi:MAG TPA: FtsQ-type POTRA domain-containing protein [Verrucomicrobiae bacterium]|nr:FtsQ-type POTRA domain-containing protein [Verrucomicrobiae bacterium]